MLKLSRYSDTKRVILMLLSIDGVVQLVVLQFSFANIKAIPATISNIGWGWETPEESEERRKRNITGSGVLVIEPTLDCSLLEFLTDLEAEWQMVEAFGQERINLNHDRRETFYMIRFIFAPRSSATPTENFLKILEDCQSGLEEMCRRAIWRVRMFSNPLYRDGVEVVGQRHLSINMEGRKPLFQPDGKPVVARLKDENRQPIGDPLPIQPEFQLRIVGETIQLVPTE